MGKRKICLFPPGLGGGGLERVFLNLAAGFIDAGMMVDLVVVNKKGSLIDQIHPLVNVVSLNSQRMLTTLPALCQYLTKEAPDVALTGLSPTHAMMSVAKGITGVKTRLFGSIHSTYPFDGEPTLKLILQQKIELASYAGAEKIIMVSHGVSKVLIENRNIPFEKVAVIYNPVLAKDFNDLMNQEIDHPFFASGQPPVILSVGRLTKAKDYETLIKAFALVLPQKAVRLIILGEGDERSVLEDLIRRYQLMNEVSLPGFVRNPYPYMKKSRLFVLSSSWEGFGNVLVEALACGCQVISTNCHSGPSEILRNGQYGKLIPVGDVEIMADAILESLQTDFVTVIDPFWLNQFHIQPVIQQYLEVFGF